MGTSIRSAPRVPYRGRCVLKCCCCKKRYKNEIGSKAVELYWGEGEEEVAEGEGGRTNDTKNKERPNHKTESKWRIASSIFFCC